ncbi:MAG: DUF4825 domain-containing protein [Eubacterium sp.]|nr:DUF4825 domain-containing protein [Eubacterium sp.]
MSKLECNIVQDLLPSFADSLVNEKTAEEIKEHLSDCKNCSKLYNEMVKGEDFEQKKAEKEINYLKKIKNKNKKIVVSILSALMIVILIAIGFYSFIGIKDNAYSVNDISVTDNLLSAEVSLFSSSNSITNVSAKEMDGIVTISVRSSLFSFTKKGSTDFGFMAEQYINKVQTSDGRVLWENGDVIPQKINDIYNAKVKYIGNNSAVSHLLSAININDTLKCGDYSIRLITDEKPYGLEIYDINSYDEMFSAFIDESYEQKLKSCAFIILACIENADFVQFKYTTPDGAEKTYKLTVEEANNYLSHVQESESIKDLAADHWLLKRMMDTVEERLITSSQFEYIPYIIENKDIADKISNNPIDKKYLDIQNNTPLFDSSKEKENYRNWAKAYEKQYEIIRNAILDYAKNMPDAESHIREPLIEAIESIKDYSKYNNIIAELYFYGIRTLDDQPYGLEYTYYTIYLQEARTKTLCLAELAYYRGVDFEWIE